MKFIKRIGNGEITIEDNKVLNLSASERADNWADQLAGEAPGKPLLADAWVGEFQQQQQNYASPQISALEQGWAHQYLDSSLAEVLKY